ncbi:MAG: alpha/beta hydrolase family protein [Promethearchaeota archaeon]
MKKIKDRLKLFRALIFIIFCAFILLAIERARSIKNYKILYSEQLANVLDVTLKPEPGVKLVGNIYIPEDNSSPIPAVIIQHGMGGRRGNLLSMALSFVKRGFVVATFDLRGHGESTGYCTLGNKESDDILLIMQYLKTNVNGSFAKIIDIGLVGHSLGAQAVILASCKSEINSCVAIAPPSNITRILDKITGATPSMLASKFYFKNPIQDRSFLDNITLINLVKNRSVLHPQPKNLLICAGIDDATINPEEVYSFFQVITGKDQPENNTLYGSFDDGTATQCNFYDNAPHGAQQYTNEVPSITADAIIWTEMALLGNNGSAPRGPVDFNHDLVQENFNQDWNLVRIFYFGSFLCLVLYLSLLSITHLKLKQKPKSLMFRPIIGSLIATPSSPQHHPHNAKKQVKDILINLLVMMLFSIIFGIFGRWLYFPFIQNSFLLSLGIHLIFIFSLPFISFITILSIKGYRGRKKAPSSDKCRNDYQYNQSNLKKFIINKLTKTFQFFLWLTQSENERCLIMGSVIGIVLGIYIPAGLVILSQWAEVEEFFKPIVYWNYYVSGVLLIGIPILFIEIFFSGYLMHDLKSTRKYRPLQKILVKISIQTIFGFLIALIICFFDPLFSGKFNYSGYNFELRYAIIAIISLINAILGLVGAVFRTITCTSIVPAIFSGCFLSWIFLSILPVI